MRIPCAPVFPRPAWNALELLGFSTSSRASNIESTVMPRTLAIEYNVLTDGFALSRSIWEIKLAEQFK